MFSFVLIAEDVGYFALNNWDDPPRGSPAPPSSRRDDIKKGKLELSVVVLITQISNIRCFESGLKWGGGVRV